MSKQKILDLLNTIYDTEDLWEIYTAADQRLSKIQIQRSKSKKTISILQQVRDEGFACLTDPFEVKSTDILSMDLYANVYVYTYGKVDKKDLVIDSLAQNSGTWVEELDFDSICDYDNLIRPSPQAWDYGNYGDPYNAIAKFKVQVLYKKKEFPGTDFRYINTDGLVKTMTVKDGKLYIGKKYFGDVAKWDTYNLFVL